MKRTRRESREKGREERKGKQTRGREVEGIPAKILKQEIG